ncbi:hypothetical protein JCM11641_002393 [Rhodosporidiobolus odoratus]
MPSATPSLLSRLSSGPSRNGRDDLHELPPHLRGNASSAPLTAQSTSPPFARKNSAASHAQPIPTTGKTPGSRWGNAASPPARSPPVLRAGSGGLATSPPSSVILGKSSSPTSGSALDQIEAMLSQMRTQSTAAAASPPLASSQPLGTSPSRWPTQPHHSPIPSAPSHSTPTPAPAKLAQPAKKQILGGRSKWARAGDAEADNFASAAERAAAEGKEVVAAKKGDAEVEVQLAPPIPPAQTIPAVAAPSTESPLLTSPAKPVSQPRLQPSSAGHIDWADDEDDDTLPTLDDWGVEPLATKTPEEEHEGEELAPFAEDPEPLPRSLPSQPPKPQPAASEQPVPPPEKERQRLRISSAAATRVISHALSGNNRIPLREPAPLPPHLALSTPAPAPPPNLSSPRAKVDRLEQQEKPAPKPLPKPTSRIFASARAAAAASSADAALPLSVSPPRHLASPPTRQSLLSTSPSGPLPPTTAPLSPPPVPKAEQPVELKPVSRKPMSPSGALFTRLSGLSASRPAAPPVPSSVVPPVVSEAKPVVDAEAQPLTNGAQTATAAAKVGDAKKRKARGGKGRGGTGAVPQPSAPTHTPAPPPLAYATPAKAVSSPRVLPAGRGGGGTQFSKWA